jgi:phosphatidylserine/phosphatidylglycerophosphate/cardiolipin synthase-like enzyme
MHRCCAILLIAALCCAAESLAQVGGRIDADVSRPDSVDAPRTIEAAFGPEAGAEALIIKVIATAKISIRLAGFAFSSPVIVAELISAKKRGVDVRVVVDRRHNVDEDEKGIGRKALALLARSHVAIRTNSDYRILHDKFLIVDERHVQTGSYNYAVSSNKNSENVLVVWNDPSLAAAYLQHWESRFKAGTDYSMQK